MKNYMKCLLSVVSVIVLLLNSSAMAALGNQTFYFDPDYAGIEKGTKAEPYNSLADVENKKLTEGTVLRLKCGTVFREAFRPQFMKGSAEHPVVLEAYGEGAAPIIRGTQQITGWSDSDGDGVWEASISDPISDFFINGEKQVLARYPNRDAENDGWDKVTERRVKDPDFARKLIVGNLKDATYWDHARCVFRAAAWVESYLDVVRWDNQTKTLYFSEDLFFKGQKYRAGWGFYMENVLEELDVDGEWYHDEKASTLYFKPPEGIDLSRDVAGGAVLDRAFDLNAGNAYIQFRDLQIEGFQTYGIFGSMANHISVENCFFQYNGESDIRLIGDKEAGVIKDIHIRNSVFKNGYKPISMGRVDGYSLKSNRIENCYHRAILLGMCGNGRVANNRILNAGYNGIHLSRPVENNIVEYNLVDGFCVEFTDGGAYYAWDNSCRFSGDPDDALTVGWSEFRSNIARDGHTEHAASGNSGHNCYGIYLDDNITKFRVIDNLLIEPGNTGCNLHNVRETETSGNLFYGGQKNSFRAYESENVGDWWNKVYGTSENMRDNHFTNNICYINTPPIGVLTALNILWYTRYDGNPNDMLGVVDYNRYFNPFQDVINKRIYYTGGVAKKGGTRIIDFLTLADHQDAAGLNIDQHSVKLAGDPHVLAAEEKGPNLLPNSDFSGPIDENAHWPRGSAKPATWVNVSVMDGCLKAVPGEGKGQVWINGDQSQSPIAVSAGQGYRLSFSAQAGAISPMAAIVSQNHGKKQFIGCHKTVNVGTEMQDYIIDFTATMDDPDVRVCFNIDAKSGFICLDNVTMKEMILTERDNSMALLNTDRENEMGVALEEGRYFDLDGTRVETPVTVPAWDARIIIRNENLIQNSDVEEGFVNGVAEGFVTQSSSASVVFSEEANVVFHGAHAQKIEAISFSQKDPVFYGQQKIPVHAGNEYTAMVYLYPSNITEGVSLKFQSDAGLNMESPADLVGLSWRKCSMTGYAASDGVGMLGVELRSPGTLFVDWMEIKQLYNKLTNWSFEEGACAGRSPAPGWIIPEGVQADYSEVSDAATGVKAQKMQCVATGLAELRTESIRLLKAGEMYVVKLKLKGKVRSGTATVKVVRAEDDQLLHQQEIEISTDYQDAEMRFTAGASDAEGTYLVISIGDEQGAAAGDYLIVDDVRYYHLYRNYTGG